MPLEVNAVAQNVRVLRDEGGASALVCRVDVQSVPPILRTDYCKDRAKVLRCGVLISHSGRVFEGETHVEPLRRGRVSALRNAACLRSGIVGNVEQLD